MPREFPFILRTTDSGATAVYAWFAAMHTRVDILLQSRGLDSGNLLDAVDDIRSTIAGLQRVGNCFDPQSELSALNSLPFGKEMTLNPSLYDMLTLCVHYNALTEGLFDISIDTPNHNGDTLSALGLLTGRRCVKLNASLRLNLSGFIKGYALDCIKELLESHGVADALVNMGNSSIMAMGDVPGPVKDGVLTTSGNSAGQQCRIVDPRDGHIITRPGERQVVTGGGAEGEVLATCLFVANPASGVNPGFITNFPSAIVK